MSAADIMNMRRIAAGIPGKAADTITTMKKVVASTITRVAGKVAAVKAADITMIKLVFFE